MRSLLDATADYPAEYSAAKELELSVIKLARIMNRASEVYKIGGTVELQDLHWWNNHAEEYDRPAPVKFALLQPAPRIFLLDSPVI